MTKQLKESEHCKVIILLGLGLYFNKFNSQINWCIAFVHTYTNKSGLSWSMPHSIWYLVDKQELYKELLFFLLGLNMKISVQPRRSCLNQDVRPELPGSVTGSGFGSCLTNFKNYW